MVHELNRWIDRWTQQELIKQTWWYVTWMRESHLFSAACLVTTCIACSYCYVNVYWFQTHRQFQPILSCISKMCLNFLFGIAQKLFDSNTNIVLSQFPSTSHTSLYLFGLVASNESLISVLFISLLFQFCLL